ncbi:MAG TPA: hypothetical protein VLB76_11325 [Thermoanaerobaculia bacterium]|jgi:hypothetical protein|nr:hypothetical protein [Thermoanaerobaculia bacterium]
MSTSKLACCAIALSVLLTAPVMAAAAAPPTITSGIDIFTTAPATQADFTNNPLPADFFCTGSSAFSGSIPLTGVPLTTVPAGIAGSTDTIVQRLANGVFSTSGTATIPVILRALKMRSSSNLSVFCPGVGNTNWQVDVCLCGTQKQTSITAKIDPACGTCGTFDGTLAVNACLRFTRLDNGKVAGPVQQPLTLGINAMPWCYKAGLNETVIPTAFSVDTNCDGQADLNLPGTTNFHPGWKCSDAGQDCWALFANLTHCHTNYTHPNEHPHCVNPVCGRQ